MSFSLKLAERVRDRLSGFPDIKIQEKKMFGGLAFLIDGKMCINVSGENLMCRFDPELQHEISAKQGYQPMMMKGRKYKGFCYVEPDGFTAEEYFEYWIGLCLDFNDKASSSKTPKQK